MKWIVPLLLASSACAAPPGGGVAAPPAAPEDVLYAQNLLASPGFEKGGFEKDRTKGWGVSLENGMEAKIESDAPGRPAKPFEGRKALHVFVKDPPKYSTKDLQGAWDAFAKGANGGKGPPRADVAQFVRVKPGARYALRLRWRASGLYDSAAPGPDRGLVDAVVRCDWYDESLRYMHGQAMTLPREVVKLPADSEEWATWAFPNYAPGAKLPYPKGKNIPFSAPGGAGYCRVFVRFTSQRPKAKPEIWLDQFEFVEIPPGVDPAQLVQPNAAAPAKPAAAQPAKPAAPGAQPAKPDAAAKPAAPGAAPATEAKEGGILKFRDLAGVEFHPYLALAGWKGSATREGPDPGAPAGSFSYRAGDVRIRASAAFETAPDGSLRASWRFTPEAEANLAMLGVVLHLPAASFKGGSVRFDSTAVELPQEPREKPWYYSGNASAVSVRGPDGGELFSFDFDAPARLALQDNRFWKGSVYELRILPPGPSPYPAGVELPFSLSLRGAAKP